MAKSTKIKSPVSIHTDTAHLATKVAISKAPCGFMFNGVSYDGAGFESSRLEIPAGSEWTCAAFCRKPDVYMVVVNIENQDVGVILRDTSMDKLREVSSKAAAAQAKVLAQEAAKADADAGTDAGKGEAPETPEAAAAK